ncbi:hypothetical protein WJX72_007067 [[Myrmecia] bisecta]|uniref:Anaphase-promoting complex subunit 4 n=1 Tax=[Myrmecia] bisecta TaxID=41462 RepID=A0AAW1PA14_9CHLO
MARSPGAGRWPAETEQLAVLCAADKTGHISCTAFGLFPIAFLDLKANGCHIAKATISPDLSRLYVLWHDKPSGNSNGWLNMSIYSTQSIEARRHELHHVAMLASHALALLDGAQQTLSACEREWRDAMEAMAGKLAVLEGLLRDHASHAKPQEEFICLLACGALSAALHQFLATNLGEAGVKRLAKAVDAAATSLGGLLVDHLQPTLEVVAFHLADLQGLAACRRWLGPIGLQEDALQTAAGGAAQLLVRVEAVRLAVCRAATGGSAHPSTAGVFLVRLSPGEGAGSQAACEVCTAAKAVVQVSGSARMRRSGYSQVHAPLIISGPRGVACVLAGTQRGVLYDLEEDEDEQLDNDEDSEEAT